MPPELDVAISGVAAGANDTCKHCADWNAHSPYTVPYLGDCNYMLSLPGYCDDIPYGSYILITFDYVASTNTLKITAGITFWYLYDPGGGGLATFEIAEAYFQLETSCRYELNELALPFLAQNDNRGGVGQACDFSSANLTITGVW